MPTPTFPLARLQTFRAELHACFSRRADALFELGDALLCAEAVPSLPHLSLEPVHQRGWGSAYAALARGQIDAERLRDLLASHLPPADPLVFAVDVTTWPRCDAECSPERGYYYHPSRHSAGQPIIAGWAWQWIAHVSFDRDSWTAPIDARRLHPLEDTDQTAAAQIHALLKRLPASGPVPLFVFDAGYDSAQLSLDLAEARVAVLVRLRADRCFYADPPPAARSPKGGRPRRHGAKFNCADPATEPGVIATLQENPTQLQRIAQGFGWSLAEPGIELLCRSPVDLYIDQWVYELLAAIERTGARRVLIDSLGDLLFAAGDETRYREYLYSLVQRCSRLGVSLLMTFELPDLFQVTRLSELGVSHVSDNVVLLQYLRQPAAIRRTLTVVKTRASLHQPQVREFTITPEGITLQDEIPADPAP